MVGSTISLSNFPGIPKDQKYVYVPNEPNEIEVPYIAVKPIRKDSEPFATVDPNGVMMGFDIEICQEGAQRFVDGDKSPINTACFIMISMLDALYKRSFNHQDLDSFRAEIQNLKF